MNTSLQLSTITTVLIGCAFSSCVYRSNPVPEMPYYPRRQPVVQPTLSAVQTPAVTAPARPASQAKPAAPARATSTPAARPAAPTTPTAPATPPRTSSTHITQPVAPQPAPTAAPTIPVAAATPPSVTPPPATVTPTVVTTVTPPASGPAPEGAANAATDPRLITNTGPIPVATRVEGDPIRVYNPLDPTKTIRIIDPSTGQVYPSGKVLRVRGTNFRFIVP